MGYLRNVKNGETKTVDVHLINNKDTESEVSFFLLRIVFIEVKSRNEGMWYNIVYPVYTRIALDTIRLFAFFIFPLLLVI